MYFGLEYCYCVIRSSGLSSSAQPPQTQDIHDKMSNSIQEPKQMQ